MAARAALVPAALGAAVMATTACGATAGDGAEETTAAERSHKDTAPGDGRGDEAAMKAPESPTDPFLWLEEVEGERALDWVKEQNRTATGALEAHPLFERMHERNLDILTSDARIPYPTIRGGKLYNFWRDDDHVRGLWRRTTRDSYRAASPEWETLLDLDALADEEDENWVWGGARCRHPDYDRCLVSLSIGGADAAVTREFDLERRAFVEDGFYLPESKSRVAWRDRDSVFLAPALSEDEMTDSGYPRTVRLWERGGDPEDAKLVFEGERSDVSVGAMRIWDKDDPYDLIYQASDFFSRHYYLYEGGETVRLAVPEDANLVGILDGQVLLELRSDWDTGERTIPRGSLAAASVDSLASGDAAPDPVFVPGERASIAGVTTTENTVLLHVLDDVVSRLVRFTRDEGSWREHELDAPDLGTITIVTADDDSDAFYYNYASFLTPSQLIEADAARDHHDALREEPAWFDPSGLEVSQHEAVSADGTKIPYFVVAPEDREARPLPTLLTGYGGFQVSRTPSYAGVLGASWLEGGGAYVLANIRGGGEFGPEWHEAARRENRQRAFDDFIAVAEDLIEQGVTTPERLGIRGGSNGGLLVGATLVQRPELFGAAVVQVPLLDMRRYHKLLAGASWMAEYGDPDDPDDWSFIREYSPYHNIDRDADYPQVLITTSTRDDRVHPGHARKMTARLLDEGHDVLYYENIEGGHGGAADLKQEAYISALVYAYLHERLSPDAAGDEDEPRASREE